MSFHASKANSAIVLKMPLGSVSYLRPFFLDVYPLFSYEYIQALTEETSTLQYGAGVDVHDNKT